MDWGARNASDLTSLLLELARSLRGLEFFAETDARRQPLLDRTYRALESELLRAGAMDLRLEPEGFRLGALPDRVPASGVLGDLREALERHRLSRIRIDPTLTRSALAGLLELMVLPARRFETTEQFAAALAARDITGLQLNDLENVAEPRPRKLSATPPRSSASLGSMLLGSDSRPGSDGIERTPNEAEETEKPTLEDRPLAVPSSHDRGERLRARLMELDLLIEDEPYARLASDIVVWAEELWREGLADECYRALLVLADHAVGSGGRSEPQARTAAACFAALARGERLENLIERAIHRIPGSGIRPAQLLLQLGEAAVPAIFEQIASENGSDRVAPLSALILMLGDASLPTLLSAIEGPDDQRARTGIRLAGELQNPNALPSLLRAMRAPDPGRRLETIRALSLLPGEDSKAALETALASDLDEIVVEATEALARCGGSEAVPALLDVLEASLHTTRTEVSHRLIAALGRLGDERAVPRLAAIVERRPLLRRAHWHAIQLAAIDALAILPTKEARRSIERAAAQGAGPVRARAEQRLAARRVDV
jgi:hypothetical protein